MYGGAGNDRITGSGLLSGGPGADELTATDGAIFRDDDGPQAAADRYIGGTDGPNQLAGAAGDDRIVGLDGDDQLLGDGHEPTLGERPIERDLLFGGAGDDGLAGGEWLVGGPGDDGLDGGRRAECGPGRDFAKPDPGAFAFVRSDCEAAEVGDDTDFVVRAPPAHAFLTNPECYCRYAHYTAKAGGVVVARATMRHEHIGYHSWPLALRLNSRGRRLLAARGRLRVTVRIYERYEYGYGASHERFRTDFVQPT